MVRRRRMVRSFTDEPVAPEVVDRILDTARRGPSAGYSQGVEFVVVTDDATRQKLASTGEETLAKSGHKNFVAQAPVHVAICVSPEIYKSRYRESDKMAVVSELTEDELWHTPFWFTDGGAALTLLLLAAVDENIAAAFIGVEPAFVRNLLDIPDDYIPIGVALLGHEAPDAERYGDVSAKKRKRRPLNEIVHRDRW
ncbi:nitroreductase [Kutzneria buriramensis]|uniref:Nitroreductase n=1 Tax=Kutzneria buriramensis TaxID=1045776 RepID=A0A3E0H0L6_9PSEU|nr:nitroreductase [Kutzneria buriramensis]